MTSEHDLIVVGAGPAGMAAAVRAAQAGLSVAVFDEQPAVGGQVFRAIETAGHDPVLRGHHTDHGRRLAQQFHAQSGIAYFPRSTVWHIELPPSDTSEEPAPLTVSVLRDGTSHTHAARRLLLATGAQERPMPLPGWTLPGVMSAGAAQILLKSSGAIPRGRTVIAGQGPLCWLIAVQLLRAGATAVHFVETTPRGRLWPALCAGGWWRGPPLLREGLSLMREARRLGLRITPHAGGLRALAADSRLAGLAWEGGDLPCDTLLLHDGVIPSTHISRALGLAHTWQDVQQYWAPLVDDWGASSHPQVAIAGDGGGIAGWQAAMARGVLAALDGACRLGVISTAQRDAQAGPERAEMARATALRPFLDRLYAPSPQPLPDDVLVCRCEEVTAGQIRQAIRLGAMGPNQIKTYLRAGMGPCQGRMCASTVAALAAAERRVPLRDIAPLRPRAPFKPITVGALIGQPATAAAALPAAPSRPPPTSSTQGVPTP